MIKLNALSVITDEEEGKNEPLSISFDSGVNRLPYGSKKIFDSLSFAFSDIVSGSLTIDGIEISANNKQNGRVYELNVCVNEVANVIGVFSLPNGLKDSLSIQRDIGKGVRALRELPVKTEDERKSKLSALLDVLSKNKVSYVLVDFNEALNGKNADAIINVLSLKKLTSIILEAKPEEKNSFVVSPGVATAVSKGGAWAFFKTEYFSYLFVTIFSLLASFGGFAATCLLGSNQILGGAISAIIAFLCLVMDFVVIASFYQSFLKNAVNEIDYLNAELIGTFATGLGLAISLGLSYLLSKHGIMISVSNVTSLSVVTACFVSALLLVATLSSRPLYILFGKVSRLLKR